MDFIYQLISSLFCILSPCSIIIANHLLVNCTPSNQYHNTTNYNQCQNWNSADLWTDNNRRWRKAVFISASLYLFLIIILGFATIIHLFDKTNLQFVLSAGLFPALLLTGTIVNLAESYIKTKQNLLKLKLLQEDPQTLTNHTPHRTTWLDHYIKTTQYKQNKLNEDQISELIEQAELDEDQRIEAQAPTHQPKRFHSTAEDQLNFDITLAETEYHPEDHKQPQPIQEWLNSQ